MSIFDENANDIEKTIFKNPLTPISKQDEETLFDDIDPSEENTPFLNEDNNEDREFFDYVNNDENDEDFFIFEDEDEDDNEDDYEEIDEDEDYEYIDEDDEDDYEEDESDESDKIESAHETQPESESKDVDPFEHLSVQAKYVIDSNRGFAQVSVDGVNALIGYVGSKISVIRKFKEELKGSMQVRMNEQPDPNTMIFIIKVGTYKTLVEVKPDSIRQLLDL